MTKLLVFFKSSPVVHCLYIICPHIEAMLSNISANFLNVLAAGGVVTNCNGDVLLIKRDGIWDLPKGKNEEGEEPMVTAVREVEEECGVDGLEVVEHLISTYHTYILEGVWVLKKTHWYRMRAKGVPATVPQAEEGITQAVWVNLQELPPLLNNTYDSIREVFKAAALI